MEYGDDEDGDEDDDPDKIRESSLSCDSSTSVNSVATQKPFWAL